MHRHRGRLGTLCRDEGEILGSNVLALLTVALSSEAGGQVVIEQMLEGRGEVGADDLIVEDVEGTEDRLVEVPTAIDVTCEIVLLGVGEERTAPFEGILHLIQGDGDLAELTLRDGLGGSYPRLLNLELFNADGIGVVGLHELVRFVLKRRKATLCILPFLGALG